VIKIKAISEIVSVVMIIAISIGLISAAYMYGLPLLQKSQDKSTLERVISFFNYYNPSSLPRKIESVAATGSTEVLTLDAQGVWEIHPFDDPSPLNNSIVFSFFSRVTNINTQQPISLTPGASCPPSGGIAGKDSFSVICLSGTPLYDGFNITYFLFLRNLTSIAGEIYSLQLFSPIGVIRRTGKTIRISRISTERMLNSTIIKLKIEIS